MIDSQTMSAALATVDVLWRKRRLYYLVHRRIGDIGDIGAADVAYVRVRVRVRVKVRVRVRVKG